MAARFENQSLADFLEGLARKTPTPGGGAVASAIGALGCALGRMVLAYSVDKKSLQTHRKTLGSAQDALTLSQTLMLRLANEDEQAYATLNTLLKLAPDDPARAKLPQAASEAARVPLACMAASVNTLRLLETLPEITNVYLRSDLAIAAVLAQAAARAGAWNVLVNLPGLDDDTQRAQMHAQMEQLLADAGSLCAKIEQACVQSA